MSNSSATPALGRRRRLRIALVVLAVIVALLVVAAAVIYKVYDDNLHPVSSSAKQQIVTIDSGATVDQIAANLRGDGLIRSTWAFEWYVRSKELRGDLQAGTYSLSPDQSVAQIVNVLTKGKVTTTLVTILPDRRLDQIRADLINDGFAPSSVDSAFNTSQYANLPVMSYVPKSANLEGLLYPDSFEKTAATAPNLIISESLTEMGKQLTPALQAAFAHEDLSVYQGITLASIVQQEVISPSDQAQAAQVFLKRLSLDMPLGSDQTAFYGAIVNGQTPSVSYDSPYNTTIYKGLPPGPISNVNDQSLDASAYPAKTDWLYFVTGDNGKTYFEKTLAQHNSDINAYCHKLCEQDSQ